MKLINNLHNIILEQSTPWYEKVFQSEDFDSLWPLIKLFGGDMHDMYLKLDKMGKGRDFLDHISTQWPEERSLEHLINALGGMKKWDRGMVDDDLMDEYVGDVYLNDMRYISKNEDGRIILELMPGEEAEFFDDMGHQRSGADCYEVAKQIFGEEGLDWDPYDSHMKIE